MVDSKVVADGLYQALERADRELRARLPAVFRKVDRIKARPGWEPFVRQRPQDLERICDRYEWRRCAHCDRRFVALTAKPARCCSPRCAGRHRFNIAPREEQPMTDEAETTPQPTAVLAPLAASTNLDDLFDADGRIKGSPANDDEDGDR